MRVRAGVRAGQKPRRGPVQACHVCELSTDRPKMTAPFTFTIPCSDCTLFLSNSGMNGSTFRGQWRWPKWSTVCKYNGGFVLENLMGYVGY